MINRNRPYIHLFGSVISFIGVSIHLVTSAMFIVVQFVLVVVGDEIQSMT